MFIVKIFIFMGEIRKNSEKTINTDNFRIKIGTTDKSSPKAIYVEGRTFITPSINKWDYTKDISEIKHNFKTAISQNLMTTPYFDKKFIIDFKVAANGIALNKKSFLSFQFWLCQKGDKILKLKDIKDTASDVILNIIDSLQKSIKEHDFILSKTKK